LISGDVLNGVGCGLGGVEHDIADKGAVEEGCDAEIEVSLRAGDGGAKIGVGITDVDVGGLSPLIASSGSRRWEIIYSITSTISLFFGSTMTT
jgi:hypothetical protein